MMDHSAEGRRWLGQAAYDLEAARTNAERFPAQGQHSGLDRFRDTAAEARAACRDAHEILQAVRALTNPSQGEVDA